MILDKRYSMVRSSPLAVELSEEQCAVLAKFVVIRDLLDGDILIREGEVGDDLHVIVSGNVAVTRESGDGNWIMLHALRPRDLAGELGFLDDLGHSATLRAMGPTEVFSLKREHLEALLELQPKIVYKVMRSIVREIHGILRRMNLQYVELSNYITKQHGRY